MTPTDLVDGHEADIVPVPCEFRAGIAEPNKESHDAARPSASARSETAHQLF
jgi:hypothetical protein